MPDKPRSAGDALSTDFVVVDENQTVAQALGQLAQGHAGHAILANSGGVPLGLLTRADLARVADPATRVGLVPRAPTLVVDAQDTLDDAVAFSVEPLAEHTDIPGLVVQTDGRAAGVLPRQAIAKLAAGLETRGLERLTGVAQTPRRHFVCPQGDYMISAGSYDYGHPPTCPNHHILLVKGT